MSSNSKWADSPPSLPSQPTQAPVRSCMTGNMADTSPPGLSDHDPSSASLTGSRFATTTNSAFSLVR